MTKQTLPLPTPTTMPTTFPGPATMPNVHNATNYERAKALAKEMADRHGRGDFNMAADQQIRDTIDSLVGHIVDGEVRWPQYFIHVSGTTQRRAIEEA